MGHTIQCSPVEVDQPYFFLHTVFESKLHPRWWSPDFWTINSRTWTSGLWFWFVSLTFFETTQYKNQWFVTRHWSLMDDWSNWFDPIPWEETSSELATNLTWVFRVWREARWSRHKSWRILKIFKMVLECWTWPCIQHVQRTYGERS